jgi:hypothetical protein
MRNRKEKWKRKRKRKRKRRGESEKVEEVVGLFLIYREGYRRRTNIVGCRFFKVFLHQNLNLMNFIFLFDFEDSEKSCTIFFFKRFLFGENSSSRIVECRSKLLQCS